MYLPSSSGRKALRLEVPLKGLPSGPTDDMVSVPAFGEPSSVQVPAAKGPVLGKGSRMSIVTCSAEINARIPRRAGPMRIWRPTSPSRKNDGLMVSTTPKPLAAVRKISAAGARIGSVVGSGLNVIVLYCKAVALVRGRLGGGTPQGG